MRDLCLRLPHRPGALGTPISSSWWWTGPTAPSG